MRGEDGIYSLPRWRLTRWLADPGPDVPPDIRIALTASLYGTLPIFFAGIANSLTVAAAIALRIPTAPFIAWVVIEAAICVARLAVLVAAQRAAAQGRQTPTDLYLSLGVAWGASVGYGVYVSMASGDWIAATLACVSAAAMVGGICFRNFAAPRLVCAMILLSLGPTAVGAVLSGEPLLLVAFIQIPLYLYAMGAAAFRLNDLLIRTTRAERENDRRARHDALTGLLNRAGLERALDATWTTRGGAPEKAALLYLDLDGFKSVNDTHGHAAGDRLLQMVAERLAGALRPDDLAARIGGDEFVVLTRGVDAAAALDAGQRMIDAIASSYDLDHGAETAIGVSVGIALAPEHGGDVATLLAAADAALYHAKSSGKSRCSLASPEVSLARLRRLHAEATAATSRKDADRAASAA